MELIFLILGKLLAWTRSFANGDVVCCTGRVVRPVPRSWVSLAGCLFRVRCNVCNLAFSDAWLLLMPLVLVAA